MISIIKECLNTKRLITLTLSITNWESIIIGYVKSIKGNVLEFEELNPYGTKIRERKIKINNIKIVCYNDVYGNDLDYLHKLVPGKGQPHYVYLSNSIDKAVLEINKLVVSKELVSFFVIDNYQIGIAEKIIEDSILIKGITYQGLLDGNTVIPIKLLTKIRLKGPIERKVNLLLNLKNPQ